jgi:magnesium-transporting ATPase (P-type)
MKGKSPRRISGVPSTALSHAIAKSLNLISGPTAAELEANDYDKAKYPNLKAEDIYSIVIHGTQMESFTPQDWEHVLAHKEVVFARTMPQQKQGKPSWGHCEKVATMH